MLFVSEVFHSLQGESTQAGRPCVFIRLAGCNLSCAYCDTAYARKQRNGGAASLAELVEEIGEFDCELVEITGGEPLLQADTVALAEWLVADGYEVMIETNGSVELPPNQGWRMIMDIKCPGSGMAASFMKDNLSRLGPIDEIKFVISGREDFEWATAKIKDWRLAKAQRTIMMSPVPGLCAPAELAEWILREAPYARLQLQLHKIIWPKGEPGGNNV